MRYISGPTRIHAPPVVTPVTLRVDALPRALLHVRTIGSESTLARSTDSVG
jgi:hypothetical protein